jgi:hypothetical protein
MSVCFYSVFILLCGQVAACHVLILPTMNKIKELTKWSKSNKGLQSRREIASSYQSVWHVCLFRHFSENVKHNSIDPQLEQMVRECCRAVTISEQT